MVKNSKSKLAGQILVEEMALMRFTPDKLSDLISANQGNGVTREDIIRIMHGNIDPLHDGQRIVKIAKAMLSLESDQVNFAYNMLREAGFIVLH